MAPSYESRRSIEDTIPLAEAGDFSHDLDHDEEGLHYRERRNSKSWSSSVLDLLSSVAGGRMRHQIYHSINPSVGGIGLSGSKVHVKRSWKSFALGAFKRIVVVGPVLILMLFGFLHLLQVFIGRARLFWDPNTEEWLPNWGEPGHFGDGLARYPTDATRDITPIPCHSHNDYWRRIPLFDAIHYGCTGVEADVWLYEDELYVGHNTASLTQNRTFRSLYVNPLVKMLDLQNTKTMFANPKGHGVFDTDPGQTLVLLVDFKTDGRELWPYVVNQLSPLREKGYLTYYDGEKTVPRAITVVGTGNTLFDLVVQNTTYRDIFFDAPLDAMWDNPRLSITPQDIGDEDIDADVDYGTAMAFDGRPASEDPAHNPKRGQGNEGIGDAIQADFNPSTSYYASVSFNHAVGFIWRGHLSNRQMNIIRGQIRGAKKRGLKARYWDTPSWPISLRNHVWHVLMKEGADVLNVDDLRSAARLDWRKWRHEWFGW